MNSRGKKREKKNAFTQALNAENQADEIKSSRT